MDTAQCHPGCQQAQAAADTLTDAARNINNAWGPGNDYAFSCDAEAVDDDDAVWIDNVRVRNLANSDRPDEASWFSFEGAAGVRMPTEAPGARTCGTQYAGWLSTPHPAAGEPPTPGVVCFDADRGAAYKDCYLSAQVEVCACAVDGGATTYLYRLPRPPRCYAAYCGTDLSCGSFAAPTCAGPTEPCYWDPTCSEPSAGLGCNAGGRHQNCRFCGFGVYSSVPCPASPMRKLLDAEAAPHESDAPGRQLYDWLPGRQPVAYGRQCYVTVRVKSAIFDTADEFVANTTLNGEEVHGKCNPAAGSNYLGADGFFTCADRAPLPLSADGRYEFVTTFSDALLHHGFAGGASVPADVAAEYSVACDGYCMPPFSPPSPQSPPPGPFSPPPPPNAPPSQPSPPLRCADLPFWIDMDEATLSQSNLGGLGPDVGAPELRFARIGKSQGQPFDLVVSNVSEYRPAKPARNGYGERSSLGVVNVAGGTSVELLARLVVAGTDEPLVMPANTSFYWVRATPHIDT